MFILRLCSPFNGKLFVSTRKAFRYGMNSNRHETGTRRSWSHTSNTAPERLAERVWWTKSQYSLLNIYFRLSGLQSSPLLTHFRHGPNTRSHYTNMWQRTHLIHDAPLSRSARRSFAPLQKLHRNHRSYVWTGAPSGIVFVPAVPKPSGIAWR